MVIFNIDWQELEEMLSVSVCSLLPHKSQPSNLLHTKYPLFCFYVFVQEIGVFPNGKDRLLTQLLVFFLHKMFQIISQGMMNYLIYSVMTLCRNI